MNKKAQLLITIFYGMILIVFIISIFVIAIHTLSDQIGDYYEDKCYNELNGTSIITYSGCNCNIFVDCDSCHETGTFCQLKNGTEIDITIRDAIA